MCNAQPTDVKLSQVKVGSASFRCGSCIQPNQAQRFYFKPNEKLFFSLPFLKNITSVSTFHLFDMVILCGWKSFTKLLHILPNMTVRKVLQIWQWCGGRRRRKLYLFFHML